MRRARAPALAGKEVTLDLAGCEVALRGPLVAGEGAHLIIEDSADATEGKPTVSKDNKVTYDAGRLYAAADAGMSYVAASAFRRQHHAEKRYRGRP